jgi:hypothetical protein
MLSFSVQRIPLILPERCGTGQLKSHLTEKEYSFIVLNGNDLNDQDLLDLASSINYLEQLHISDVEIKGSCLEAILAIPGLNTLNLSCNTSLGKEFVIAALSNDQIGIKLNNLNLADNAFSFDTLHTIIKLTEARSNNQGFTLNLGEIGHLDEAEFSQIKMLTESIKKRNPAFSCTYSWLRPEGHNSMVPSYSSNRRNGY